MKNLWTLVWAGLIWTNGMTGMAAQDSGGPFDGPPPGGVVGISAKAFPKVRGIAGRMVEKGLTWLVTQQQEDGSFLPEGAGPAERVNAVGVTGLVVLALVGSGETMLRGDHRDVLQRAVEFLKESQNEKTGLIGSAKGHTVLYNHGIATVAVAQVYGLHRSPILKSVVQKAVGVIERARNPYSGWRYGLVPDGDNDTSVTAWMVTALDQARRAGIEVDPKTTGGAVRYLKEVTDSLTGRVGYSTFTSRSARTPANKQFPPDSGEAMTGAGMYAMILMDEEYADGTMAEKQRALMLKMQPEWEPEGFGMDLYYWHWASRALARSGGKAGRNWRSALERAAKSGQVGKGELKGSWGPVGPWGYVGGRAYSTAMVLLALEAESVEGR